MRITMNVLKTPRGFLGGLPGPSVWKQLHTMFLAKLKSTFRKRVSRVSCSSCPAWGHLLSLDVSQKIRDPNLNINVRNFGTSQRAYSTVVSGSGGNSSTIYGPVTTVPISAGSHLNVFVPQIVRDEAIPTAHGQTPVNLQSQATITVVGQARIAPAGYFKDFPGKTAMEICKAAYSEWEKIVQEAEREFHVQL